MFSLKNGDPDTTLTNLAFIYGVPEVDKLFIAASLLSFLSTSIVVCEKDSKEISKRQQEINLFILLI
jgi:hypothetical protein